ncbi:MULTISPECIES: C45 family autoproteolytic acyltransferase/hydolase [unclassified Microbacterium]|uniref:C45 family autoproteolytic acyltransferase/hydolase n=1 Tax=unclassified Microbacterium TaxID=2609290 RepID=UPI0004932F00|nr:MULTISPECIES: C45 family peptidase [unclassified Microbacterium]
MAAMTPIRTIEISGAPRERGRRYGEAAADLIAGSIEYYTEALTQQTGMSWAAITDSVSRWVPISEQIAPHLVEEMRGIAEGAGVAFAEIVTLNVRGEFVYDHQGPSRVTSTTVRAADDERDDAVDGCTSFFLTGEGSGTGHTLVGQNWDWRTRTAGTTLIVRVVQDPLPTVIMQVEAGQVGRHGANSAGISLNANGLGGSFGAAVGVPQTLIRRLVLDQGDIASALRMLVKTRPHIASNALLADRSGFGIDLETTPSGVDWIYPERGVIAHTNHFQASVPPQLAGSYLPVAADSLLRLPRAQAGLAAVARAENPEQSYALVREAMSDHLGFPEGVCTHPHPDSPSVKQWSTLLSSCVDLTTGEYRVANGFPCETEYEVLPWNLYDGPHVELPSP